MEDLLDLDEELDRELLEDLLELEPEDLLDLDDELERELTVLELDLLDLLELVESVSLSLLPLLLLLSPSLPRSGTLSLGFDACLYAFVTAESIG